MKDMEELQSSCKYRVEEALAGMDETRDSKWTESIAVGSEKFIEATKSLLGIKARGRKVIGGEKSFELREPAGIYGNITPENNGLSFQNGCFWADFQ